MSLYIETLMATAQEYWDAGQSVPLDLFAEMMAAGLDVETLEAKHKKEL